jgi:hypothetical protein
MPTMSPEMQSKIALWRAKGVAGTLTEEEMIEGIKLLRQDRFGAATASDAAKRKTAKAVIPDADDLLKELGDFGEGT